MSKIRIDKPCHENWDDMTPTEQGRHCMKCSMTVLDAMNLSDEEIVNIYEQNNNLLCIRIPENRLAPPKKRYFKYAFLTAILLWFSGWVNKVFAQVSDSLIVNAQDSTKTFSSIRVSGTVKDTINSDDPVAYVTLQLYHNNELIGGTYSDENGQFSIEAKKNISSTDSLTLVTKYLSYQDNKKIINLGSDSLNQEVITEDNQISINQDIVLTSFIDVRLGVMETFTVGMIKPLPKININKTSNTTTYDSDEIERSNLGR